ncbi:hypothetical protein WG904_11795 [Pedobacter sp. Du54]|uniref:hypothetical protein n=1 Tax=Pedobacter anseongensis TaxID=3133439 RepID=UPI0030A5931C
MIENALIPEQVIGSEMNVKAKATFETLENAIAFYRIAKKRLKSINSWSKVCGTEATTFELLNANGDAPGELSEGSLIKIDIPGPGTHLGNGYDWVQIEQVLENENNCQFFGFRVRPCSNPEKPEQGIAHFFKDTATSSFLVGLSGNTVYAEIHGKNEEPNTMDSGFFDGLRNMAVGYSAKIGLSFPQWKLLVEGIVDGNHK